MKLLRQLAHMERGAIGMAPDDAPPSASAAADCSSIVLPREQPQMLGGIVAAGGLVEPAPADRHHRIAAEHQPAPGTSTDTASALASASAVAISRRRPPAAERSLERALVDLRRAHFERDAGGVRASPRRDALLRGEHDHHAVRPGPPASRRSLYKLDDRRGGLLDRAARDVDHRPAVVGEHAAGKGDSARPAPRRHKRSRALVEREQPVAADLDQPLGRGGEADHHRMPQAEQRRGRRAFDHQRDVRRPCSPRLAR